MIKKTILNQLAKEFDIPEDTINKLYVAYWKEIKDIISSLDHKDIEEGKCPEFNIPGLGKLQINELALKYINERHKDKND